MELVFKRRLKPNKYIYESNDYHSESNYTLNIGLRKLTAFDQHNEPIYILKQTNWLCKMITWIPLFWLSPISPLPKYKFYDKGICTGQTKMACASPRRLITINDHCYELFIHSNNYISVLKNDMQIALVHKAEETYNERNTYTIDLDEKLEGDIRLIALFIAFIDVVFFPGDGQFWTHRKEKTIGFDKLYHRTSWKPADPEVQKEQEAEHVLEQMKQ